MIFTSFIEGIAILLISIVVFALLLNFISHEPLIFNVCYENLVNVSTSSNYAIITSDKSLNIHVYVINCTDLSYVHLIEKTPMKIKFNKNNQILVVLSDSVAVVKGNVHCLRKSIYVSSCGIYIHEPSCEPWIKLPNLEKSYPEALNECIGKTFTHIWIGGLLKITIS